MEAELRKPCNPSADPEEQKLLLSVLDSFRSYRRLAHYNGTHLRRQAFYSLPQSHWTLLSRPPFSILSTLSQVDDLIDSNAELAEAVFVTGFKTFLAPTLDSDWVASIVPEKHARNEYKVFDIVMDALGAKTSQGDVDKARSCVNQFWREWSQAGHVERVKCFDPVVAALEQEFTSRSSTMSGPDRANLKVLVPGVGLGRLVFDLCRAGFTVEGNEISYHMLMASALVLNETQGTGQFKIAPWALNSSNHVSRNDQLKTVRVPDVHPATELAKEGTSRVPASERMSMSTGDFCVVYGRQDYADEFDAVATVFFIDTAPNLIRYIEAVRNCLKSGGLWINLGPLLWHPPPRRVDDEDDMAEDERRRGDVDAGIGDPGSVELTNEEVIALVEHFGFVMERQEHGIIDTGYISNTRSMLQSTYRPSFWIARKK
ncbi:carnosine N-methyltransferase [Alternaria panax]|uniref:carnosine N-methyltransferase n=1 Tax=Alternaria panax TaxID=48097 RepID=A0AAD4IBN4_9PLEO|nr:carnosine N-methyltransferase [Alternaria panax]